MDEVIKFLEDNRDCRLRFDIQPIGSLKFIAGRSIPGWYASFSGNCGIDTQSGRAETPEEAIRIAIRNTRVAIEGRIPPA
jgi:hypothetical protein